MAVDVANEGTAEHAGRESRGVKAVDVLATRDLFGHAVVAEGGDALVKVFTQVLDVGERCDVAFLNAHASNVAARDPEFSRVLNGFVLLNDGLGVDLASRWAHGESFPENLNGTDFVPRFLASVDRPLRIHLLGGRPGVAEAAARKLALVAPQHVVVGTRHGYFSQREAARVVEEVSRSRADVLLVAMGNPVQEKFVHQHRDALGVPLTFSVGALLDFLAGGVDRAPDWVQWARSEWAWRLAQEPRRLWRRYLVGNAVFLLRTVCHPRAAAQRPR